MLPQVMCQICGSELRDARWRLVGVCGRAKCQLARARLLQTSRFAEKLAEEQVLRQIAEAYRDQEAARLGIDQPEMILPVVVPANLRRIVTLPERRKRAFREFLMQLVSQAAALRASKDYTEEGDSPIFPGEKSGSSPGNPVQDSSAAQPSTLEELLLRGCATCRGRCCNGGGDHAYLDVNALVHYMRRHPKQRPRHVLEAYLSRLPYKAYQNSCIYHRENGCALPREMRSNISRDFFCGALRSFQRNYGQKAGAEMVFFAFEGTQVVRTESFAALKAKR
jgi:hypothetical protein